MPYKHLTDYERYLIHHLNLFRLSNAEIARRLERSPSTISRELRRNANSMGQYLPEHAQQLTRQRRQAVVDERLFRPPLQFVGARDQREHQRPAASIFAQVA